MKKKKSEGAGALEAPAAGNRKSPPVAIDFPMEGEIVQSASYTVRVGGLPAEKMDVSIDGREWEACRPSVGYWWYDWSGYQSGPHMIQARAPSGKRYVKSIIRQFTVLI